MYRHFVREWYRIDTRCAAAPWSEGSGGGSGGGGGGSIPAAAGGKEEAERVARGEVVNENFNIRSEVTRAAVKIQAHYRGYAVRKAFKLYRVGGQVSELLYSPGSGEAAPKTAPRPRGRMNAAVAVRGNNLYMFGGAVEIGDQEAGGPESVHLTRHDFSRSTAQKRHFEVKHAHVSHVMISISVVNGLKTDG